MATTTEAPRPDAQQYVDYEEYVDFQLEKTRSSIKFTDVFTTLTALAVAVIGYLLVFVVLDQWVIEGGFSYSARVGLLSVVAAVVMGTLTWRVFLPVIRRVHPLYAARVIERSDPNLKSNLVNFVDVREANAQSAPVVLKAMQKRAAVELSHIDVEEAVDRRPLLRVAYALLGVVIVGALYILLSPKDALTSVRRALLPTAAIEVATETTITEVVPGEKNPKVAARTTVTVSAEVRGKDADTAQILFTTADQKYVNHPVEMKRDEPTLPRFSGVLNGENGRGLLQTVTYRIVAGDARTPEYRITVIQPPSARVDEVQYEFPKYMELENRRSAEAHIDGWEGATVTVKATANMPVKSARIVLTDSEDRQAKGEEIPMFITDGTDLSATWKLDIRGDGSSPHFYHIAVANLEDQTDDDPMQYTYRIRPDQRPEVSLLAPTGDLGVDPEPPVPSNAVIPLIIQAADPDFKLRSIALKVERNGESVFDKKLFDDHLPAPTASGNYDFSLASIRNLKEGEILQLWIEAKDNKQPTANRRTTPRINIHLGKPASPKEVEKQLAEEKKKQEQLEKSGDQQNPERPDASPPPDSGEEPKPEKPQPRPDPGDPKERQKPDKQRPEKEPDAAPEKQQGEERQPGEKKRPDTIQEALQKLLQKEQEKQQPGDRQPEDEQAQPQPRDQKDAGEKNPKQPQAGQRGEDGEKSPGTTPKNKTGNNASQQPNSSPGTEKPKPGDRTQDKNENRGQDPQKNPRTDPQSNQSDGKGPKGNDKDKPQPKGKTGDNPGGAGQADDEKPSGKPDSDQQRKSPKTPDSKPADAEKKDGADKPNADKPEAVKKPTAGNPSEEKEQPGAGDSEKSPKKDGATNGGKKDDDKPPDSPDSKDPGKQAAGKDDTGKNDTQKKDTGKEGDQGKNGDSADGKNDSPKTEKTGADPQKPDADKPPADPQKKSPQGGVGNEEKNPSDPGDSKDPSSAKGSKSESDKLEGDKQAGEAGGTKTKKTDDKEGRKTRDAGETGEEKPADDSDDAVKKKATEKDAGEATGDPDGDPEAPKASDKVTKKPGSEPGAKKKSQGDSKPEATKPGNKRQPEEGTPGSSSNPDKVKRPADGKEPTERPGNLDDPQSRERPDLTKNRDPEKRPGQPPSGGNPELQGEGSKDQKSKQSDSGEKGGGETADQGKPGANEAGSGDESDEAGGTDTAKKTAGKPGDKKGKGSQTRPTDEKGQQDSSPGKEPGKEPSSKKSQGKSSNQPGKSGDESKEPGNQDSKGDKGKPGGGKPGGKTGEPGKDGAGSQKGTNPDPGKSNGEPSSPGKPGNTGNSPRGSGITSRPGEGSEPTDGKGGPSDGENPKARDVNGDDEPPSPEEDEANLEHARKATNLVLTKLKNQLDRGEVDQKLLEELGWKDRQDLERLVKFLDKGLNDPGDDNSPEALARKQQFEELLKSMPLGNETGSRSGGAGTTRRIRAMGDRNVPVPPEYRKLYEAYTRSNSKNPDGAGKKK